MSTMDYPNVIDSNQKEESISIQRVNVSTISIGQYHFYPKYLDI